MPSVLPLTVVLVVLIIPMAMCAIYVRHRRVDTEVHAWTGKRVLWSVLGSLPYVVFVIGALYVLQPDSSTWLGAIVGAVFGGTIGIVATVVRVRRRRRQEALAAASGDED
jgi:hypothetical protein